MMFTDAPGMLYYTQYRRIILISPDVVWVFLYWNIYACSDCSNTCRKL